VVYCYKEGIRVYLYEASVCRNLRGVLLLLRLKLVKKYRILST